MLNDYNTDDNKELNIIDEEDVDSEEFDDDFTIKPEDMLSVKDMDYIMDDKPYIDDYFFHDNDLDEYDDLTNRGRH